MKRFLKATLSFLLAASMVVCQPVKTQAAEKLNKTEGVSKSGSTYTLTTGAWQSEKVYSKNNYSTKNGFTLSYSFMSKKLSGSAHGIYAIFSEAPCNVKDRFAVDGKENTYGVGTVVWAGGKPNYEHVAILNKDSSNIVEEAAYDKASDGKWHTMKIDVTKKSITAYIDGKKIVGAKNLKLPDKVYVSIAGVTGVMYNLQKVKDIKITSCTLNLSEKEIRLLPGESISVQYSLEGNTAPYKNLKPEWSLSSKSVAKVSSKGKVVAQSTGVCKLTCKVGDLSKTIKVIVLPKKVQDIKASSTSNRVTLTWKKQDGVSSYQIFMYDKDLDEFVNAYSVSGSFNTANIDKLKKNTNYQFKVRAVLKDGSSKYYGEFSKVVKIKTKK